MNDIVVIGGGIAGLYCAYKIDKKYDVSLFESGSVFGGRVYTDEFTIDGKKYTLEAGAGRILSTHTLMLNLIKDMKLIESLIKIDSKVKFIPSKYYSLRDKFQEETGYNYIDKVIKKSKNLSRQYLKSVSFKELSLKYLTSEEVKFMLDSSGYYGDLVIQNAYDAINVFSHSVRVDKKYYILKGGFGKLIKTMVRHVKNKHNCHLNKKCYSVNYNDGVFTMNINNKMVLSKKVVLAIPKQNLLDIDFLKPYFPLLKSINLIRLVRIYSIYSPEHVWFNNMGKVTTNNNLGYIIPISSENGVIMTSYTDYTRGNYWSKISKNKKVLNDTLNKNIENVFNIVPKNPKDIKVYDWENGVALWKKNVDSEVLIKKISNPIKGIPLYIVGENYSKYQGWMEGSLNSVNSIISQLN